ncbi:uncharacterized protein LOC100179162 isoform X2 [Ciona intestinalis]
METNSSKTVLITGASGGLGEEIAYSFSGKGMVVVISGQNQENLSKVSEKCKAQGAAKVVVVPGNLRIIEDIERIVETTVKECGRLDVLVNNAGTLGSGGGIAESTVEDLNEIYDVNIRAPFYLTKLCMPHLIKTEGCVVNVSSIATEIYIPECVQYSMAKSALDHFTKCGALAQAPCKLKFYTEHLDQKKHLNYLRNLSLFILSDQAASL